MEVAAKQLASLLGQGSSPLSIAAVFVALSMLPLLVLATTSFIKFSVVFAALRSALGAQQVPSGAICSVLALVLTLYVMAPVGKDSLERATTAWHAYCAAPEVGISSVVAEAFEPFAAFMRRHSALRERAFFASRQNHVKPCRPQSDGAEFQKCIEAAEGAVSLVAAFVVSQLREAFVVGFLIFLPFLVLDLVIANVLLGLGMMMLSPMVVSLPFKIALFVAADGWFLLSKNLLLSYSGGGQ